jgi:hypothetical protein
MTLPLAMLPHCPKLRCGSPYIAWNLTRFPLATLQACSKLLCVLWCLLVNVKISASGRPCSGKYLIGICTEAICCHANSASARHSVYLNIAMLLMTSTERSGFLGLRRWFGDGGNDHSAMSVACCSWYHTVVKIIDLIGIRDTCLYLHSFYRMEFEKNYRIAGTMVKENGELHDFKARLWESRRKKL